MAPGTCGGRVRSDPVAWRVDSPRACPDLRAAADRRRPSLAAGRWPPAIVLLGYRPGGPVDLAVGLAAAGPVAIALAGLLWPPAARGVAGVRGDGLARARVAARARPVDRRRRRPARRAAPRRCCRRSRRPTRGASRCSGRACSPASGSPGASSARPRCAGVASPAASLVATVLAVAAGIALHGRRDGQRARAARPADAVVAVRPDRRRATSRRRATARSRSATTAAARAPPRRRPRRPVDRHGRPRRRPRSAATSAGSPTRRRRRSSASTARPGSATDAWIREPFGGWRRATPLEVADGTVDAQAFEAALRRRDAGDAAELHGVDVIEGARARHCRIAIDGPTFRSRVPGRSPGSSATPTWPAGGASSTTGSSSTASSAGSTGSVNGDAGGIREGALQGTIRVNLIATSRGGRDLRHRSRRTR